MTTDLAAPALPRLALTMGDPAGVGPEILAAVWADPRIWQVCRPAVFGDAATLRRAADLRGLKAEVEAAPLALAFERAAPDRVTCVGSNASASLAIAPGVVTAQTGAAAYEAVVAAARAALAGDCEGIVTGPLSKAALHAAGRPYPGHTELLAELCGVDDFAMMLYLPPSLVPKTRCGLGVVHVTLHVALREAIGALTIEAIEEKCQLAHQAALAYGVDRPRVGVAALNPHAGEEGLFGDEEARLIAPAVARARTAGIDATGPWPVDTLMVRATQGEFDAVVAMYHDQGHIALKLLGMHGAVNVTLGLPIVRTSVAHGTAADLAWRGVAETSGMIAAISAAASLARRRAGQ
ncbi:4-hydroxythreonine-4-phosphate dehydrogenase PdxA [Botrimarina hoheduenensis]|uniref:4-hydroxythreonine-4-phosphate dehydrogenase n=1 Tax=Botrimarina hoheduenensis TaxID=2528000 RepID=A0A5C5VVK2_9BACT|nr:4-hydroxythreonine-4-phosphate dehydrogenase PdxA [Botrimarina hoheduenensis]TWT41552.1 4-hydroxythreonine-4-phosphate dehydrogenase [Botrimarina hoheduenensis]